MNLIEAIGHVAIQFEVIIEYCIAASHKLFNF